ncbi:MAG: peptidylprolyl isomerase, partial [Myxococcaceae bacterium]
VVTTDYGFHLFKVLERRPARKRDLASVRGEVERRLLRNKQEQAQTEFVSQLRAKADVRINEALVAQVVPRAPVGASQETHR